MRLYFLVVQFIPFTTVSIQYYHNNAFLHKIGLKKDNEIPIITHIIVVGFSQWQSVKTVTCAKLNVIKCVDDFIGWNQLWRSATSGIFVDIPCRNLNDLNKENGLHENTNISAKFVLVRFFVFVRCWIKGLWTFCKRIDVWFTYRSPYKWYTNAFHKDIILFENKN